MVPSKVPYVVRIKTTESPEHVKGYREPRVWYRKRK